MNNLYSNDINQVYDPITENLNDCNEECYKSFYYFNIQKEQDEYYQDRLNNLTKEGRRNPKTLSLIKQNLTKNNSEMEEESEFNKFPQFGNNTNRRPQDDMNWIEELMGEDNIMNTK